MSRNQIVLFGLMVHLLTAFFSVGVHQSDELFQVYEFAGYKLGINRVGDLPWEFASQMRSGIQPFIVYSITKLFLALTVHNPFTISFFIRLCTSLFSFGATVLLLRELEKDIKTPQWKNWLWVFGLLFWCLPYFHARFSAENFSATLFVFGLVMVLRHLSFPDQNGYLFLAGLFFGLSFWCRFQMSFMIAGLLVWLLFLRKIKWVPVLLIVAGMLLAFIPGLLADRWLYGQWTFSPWNYLDLNLFQDKASQFGYQPVYYYLNQSLLQLIPPFSLLILGCVFMFWWRFNKHVITWVTLPFVLLHILVGHKELRFLFPILNFLPFMTLYTLQSFQERDHLWKLLSKQWILRVALVVNGLLLVYFMFKPADTISHQLEKIYSTVRGNAPLLLYERETPYNNLASLNYFRNRAVQTLDLKKDTVGGLRSENVYYISEKFNEGDKVIKNHTIFVKVYSNFPVWFSYLNFNGWLERNGTFSIYKMENRWGDL